MGEGGRRVVQCVTPPVDVDGMPLLVLLLFPFLLFLPLPFSSSFFRILAHQSIPLSTPSPSFLPLALLPGPFSLDLLHHRDTWLPAPYDFTFYLSPVLSQEGVVVTVGAGAGVLGDIDVFGDLFPAYTQVQYSSSQYILFFAFFCFYGGFKYISIHSINRLFHAVQSNNALNHCALSLCTLSIQPNTMHTLNSP